MIKKDSTSGVLMTQTEGEKLEVIVQTNVVTTTF